MTVFSELPLSDLSPTRESRGVLPGSPYQLCLSQERGGGGADRHQVSLNPATHRANGVRVKVVRVRVRVGVSGGGVCFFGANAPGRMEKSTK